MYLESAVIHTNNISLDCEGSTRSHRERGLVQRDVWLAEDHQGGVEAAARLAAVADEASVHSRVTVSHVRDDQTPVCSVVEGDVPGEGGRNYVRAVQAEATLMSPLPPPLPSLQQRAHLC